MQLFLIASAACRYSFNSSRPRRSSTSVRSDRSLWSSGTNRASRSVLPGWPCYSCWSRRSLDSGTPSGTGRTNWTRQIVCRRSNWPERTVWTPVSVRSGRSLFASSANFVAFHCKCRNHPQGQQSQQKAEKDPRKNDDNL